MGDKKIEENPFAALFPTVSQAQQFVGTQLVSQKDINKDSCCTQVIASTSQRETKKEKESKDVKDQTFQVSRLVEKIFLITLDNDFQADPDRPVWLVYLKELSDALDSQTWIDTNCLGQAVFERLMLENPAEYIRTTQNSGKDVTSSSQAAEPDALRYLFHCFKRWLDVIMQCEDTTLASHLTSCKDVILTNARVCLQQPELFPSQNIHLQFMDIYHNECQFSTDLTDAAEQFFLDVSKEIEKNEEDGTLADVFKPVLDYLKKRFTNELSLIHSETLRCINMMTFFTKTEGLAKAFLNYNTVLSSSNGRAYENTLIGSVLSLSCIPKSETGPYDFFNNPSSYTRQEHDITESNLWQPLSLIGERIHHLFMSIIRISPDLRHQVMSWLARCIHANFGRTKIWSNQVPQLFNQMYCSEGFSLNLCSVMLRLCQPFAEPLSPKLLKIQPSYTAAKAIDEEDAKRRGIHAQGLSSATTLIPSPENVTPPSDTVYTFITECFFMCEQCLHLGFHMVHDKILKLNQDLHRVQRLYSEVREQAVSDEAEPVRSIKMQMDKGMTLFLSMKAALTEPKLMEMSLNFHLATATWLTQVAVHRDVTQFRVITFPLPDDVPDALCYIPEFIMGNITDFVLFCHRFKDDMFELAGGRVEHLMTLILVFMGSPQRMKNPHLRAEFADMLSALMPQNPTTAPSAVGLLSRFHREQLFVKHPLISHLAETLLHVFVSIEMTGQSVEFEQKFNYRRPMYIVLEYIWEIDLHKQAIMTLAAEAEANMEATDAPLFLRFINLLINDAIFLLDEALSYMSQIKEKQQEKERGDWEQQDARQRQETEMNFRHLGLLARYHNVMANYTIHALELLTTSIKSIFCHNTMVDRITGMLNYFLLHLVGPKQKNFSVKDKNEYEFKPHQIVLDIIKIYLNLGDSESFCTAVTHDGRSYSPDLFDKAVQVLGKISNSPQITSDFLALDDKIRTMAEERREEEDMMADAPEEFLDPLLGTLMRDPVLLPTSKKLIDRSVIARHILSDQSDPFNRQPLSMDMVIPDTEMKQKIDDWIAEMKKKLRSVSSS